MSYHSQSEIYQLDSTQLQYQCSVSSAVKSCLVLPSGTLLVTSSSVLLYPAMTTLLTFPAEMIHVSCLENMIVTASRDALFLFSVSPDTLECSLLCQQPLEGEVSALSACFFQGRSFNQSLTLSFNHSLFHSFCKTHSLSH